MQPLKGDHRGSAEGHVHALGDLSTLHTNFPWSCFFIEFAFTPSVLATLYNTTQDLYVLLDAKNHLFFFHFLEESADLEKFHPYSITAEIFHKDIKNDKQFNGVKETNTTLVTMGAVLQCNSV